MLAVVDYKSAEVKSRSLRYVSNRSFAQPYLSTYFLRYIPIIRVSVNGRMRAYYASENLAKTTKIRWPGVEHAQNKMAGVHVRRKIIKLG